LPAGCYRFGWARLRAADYFVDKLFVKSQRFTYVRGTPLNAAGDLAFRQRNPTSVCFNGTPYQNYRTVYGYAFAHGARIFANTPNSIALAVRRVTGVRKPEYPGIDRAYELRNNSAHAGDTLSYRWELDDYRHTLSEYVKKPHPKKMLRISAFRDALDQGFAAHAVWNQHTLLKLKKDEFAKPGKYPRSIGDLSTPASLQGSEFLELVKQRFSEPRWYLGCRFEAMLYPTKQLLVDMFTREPVYLDWYAFSDDSFIACSDRTATPGIYDSDMDACDLSHFQKMMDAMFVDFGFPEDIATAVRGQIMHDIYIRNPYAPHERTVLRPRELWLPSGSIITTLINTYASWCAFRECARRRTLDACEDTGYFYTIKKHSKLSEATFLKFSPVMTDAGLEVALNPGVVFRATGTSRGDVPGRGPLVQRALTHQSGMMAGFKTHVWHKEWDVLCPISDVSPKPLTDAIHTWVHDDRTQIVFDDRLYDRYSLSTAEIQELHSVIKQLALGVIAYSPVVDKIIAHDYGYPAACL